MQILRPESITPIARYLADRRRQPEDAGTQIAFASVLLHREREYRAMYSSQWLMGATPAPLPDSPFAPFDLTPEAAAILTRAVAGTLSPHVNEPDDLFGLKGEALEGLAGTLRPVKVHALGALFHVRLLTDVCRFADAIAAAERALTMDRSNAAAALALVHDAALLGAAAGDLPSGESIARGAAARARRIQPRPRGGSRWDRHALDALHERMRQHALRIRVRVEGESFTRYLMTELAFCRSERDAALAAFKDGRVPKALRHLIPLARAIGVGDDPCRALLIGRMTARERNAATADILASAGAIDQWLASVGPPPYEGETAAFFWLREAAEEVGSRPAARARA
jgi:hypothetical protein